MLVSQYSKRRRGEWADRFGRGNEGRRGICAMTVAMVSSKNGGRRRNSLEKTSRRMAKIGDISRLFNGLAVMAGFLTWHTRLSMVRAVSAGGQAAIAAEPRVSAA